MCAQLKTMATYKNIYDKYLNIMSMLEYRGAQNKPEKLNEHDFNQQCKRGVVRINFKSTARNPTLYWPHTQSMAQPHDCEVIIIVSNKYRGGMELEKLLRSSKATELLVVADITNSMHKLVNNNDFSDKVIRLLNIDTYFTIEVPRHTYQPHVHLPDTDEIQRVVEFSKKDVRLLARMYESDPLAVWYGIIAGEVVKLVAPSEISGSTTIYRLCVPDHYNMQEDEETDEES